MLHHSEGTKNADFKRLANNSNSGVISVKIPCNGQPEKYLGNSLPKGEIIANEHHSKITDIDMLVLDQGYQEH